MYLFGQSHHMCLRIPTSVSKHHQPRPQVPRLTRARLTCHAGEFVHRDKITTLQGVEHATRLLEAEADCWSNLQEGHPLSRLQQWQSQYLGQGQHITLKKARAVEKYWSKCLQYSWSVRCLIRNRGQSSGLKKDRIFKRNH